MHLWRLKNTTFRILVFSSSIDNGGLANTMSLIYPRKRKPKVWDLESRPRSSSFLANSTGSKFSIITVGNYVGIMRWISGLIIKLHLKRVLVAWKRERRRILQFSLVTNWLSQRWTLIPPFPDMVHQTIADAVTWETLYTSSSHL